jgi:hypothetical protein
MIIHISHDYDKKYIVEPGAPTYVSVLTRCDWEGAENGSILPVNHMQHPSHPRNG